MSFSETVFTCSQFHSSELITVITQTTTAVHCFCRLLKRKSDLNKWECDVKHFEFGSKIIIDTIKTAKS